MPDGLKPLGEAPTLQRETRSWAAPEVPAAWATLTVPVIEPAAYQIVREVARGGMGRILEAVDTRLGREVALKLLLGPDSDQGRFVREAVLTARLQHPSIVAVHEVGVFPSGELFIAMKLVRGEALQEAIQQRSSLAERLDLIPSVLAISEAMAYAHSRRVIHRDLKPSNVLLGSFGETVVIDWGLAKHLEVVEPADRSTNPRSTEADQTRDGAIVGTPAYMPPEQALGRPLDERADVYALGAILYEVLTGTPPMEGNSAEEILRNLAQLRRPRPIEERVPEAPAELVAIVAKAMMPDPDARHPSARELALELRRFLLGQPVEIEIGERGRDPVMEAAFAQELRERSNQGLRVLGGFGALALAGFGVIPWLYHGGFVAADLWPRAIVVLGMIGFFAVTYLPAGKRYSRELAAACVLSAGLFFVVVNVVEHNAIGWFTGSTIAALLAGVMLFPLTLRGSLVVAGVLSAFSVAEGILTRMPLMSVSFLLQVSLVGSCAAIAVIAATLAARLRRAEFLSRYRLKSANERLARLEARHGASAPAAGADGDSSKGAG